MTLNRPDMLAAMECSTKLWDVLIVGGGATGLGAAVESASRGHRTVLVEAYDFAKGTSSRSTKLIHGGVRYLAMGQIRMVRQSLVERERLLRNAAGIVQPLDFVLPASSRFRQCLHFAGLRTYDVLAGHWWKRRSRWLSLAAVRETLPTLRADDICGGVQYTDAQFDDARLAISLAATAVEHGAVVANYVPVQRLLHVAGRVTGAVVQDQESGREFAIKAKVVINATGVFAEQVMQLDSSHAATQNPQRPQVVASQGSHLVVDQSFLPGRTGLLIPKTDDGRVLFAIPWLNRVIIGTTDCAVSQIELEPRPLVEEVDYLLRHAGRYLTRAPAKSDVLTRFAGLRPLVGRSGHVATSRLSREHDISVSPGGMITVIGGKWTTYRRMGEELINRAEQVASLKRRLSVTADLPLVPLGTMNAAADEVLHPRLPYRESDVTRAVQQEMARTVEDVLARRTRSLFLDARAAESIAPRVAQILREQLGRSDSWELDQQTDFLTLAVNY